MKKTTACVLALALAATMTWAGLAGAATADEAKAVVHPTRPQMEGKDLSGMKDVKGNSYS